MFPKDPTATLDSLLLDITSIIELFNSLKVFLLIICPFLLTNYLFLISFFIFSI